MLYNFLKDSIDDTQSTIRALDLKMSFYLIFTLGLITLILSKNIFCFFYDGWICSFGLYIACLVFLAVAVGVIIYSLQAKVKKQKTSSFYGSISNESSIEGLNIDKLKTLSEDSRKQFLVSELYKEKVNLVKIRDEKMAQDKLFLCVFCVGFSLLVLSIFANCYTNKNHKELLCNNFSSSLQINVESLLK